MALRSSGLKPRKKSVEVPQGISRSNTGKLVVSDKEYLKALHQSTSVPPLNLGVQPHVGAVDLHHTKNPDGKRRRANDASVVKLDHAEHMEIDANDASYGVPFGAWAACHYWSFKHGCLEDEDRGQMFLKWVLEKLEEEDG